MHKTPTGPITTIRLGAELRAGMATLTARDGITVSEQIRRAVAAFLAAKGIAIGKPGKGRRRG